MSNNKNTTGLTVVSDELSTAPTRIDPDNVEISGVNIYREGIDAADLRGFHAVITAVGDEDYVEIGTISGWHALNVGDPFDLHDQAESIDADAERLATAAAQLLENPEMMWVTGHRIDQACAT